MSQALLGTIVTLVNEKEVLKSFGIEEKESVIRVIQISVN